MTRFSCFLLAAGLLIVVATRVAAAGQVEEIRSGNPHEKLFAVDFDATTGYAVGDHGLILRSTDGGGSWVQESSPTQLALLGVTVAGETAVAVGQMGTVLVRESDGQWRSVNSGSQERLLDVDMNQAGVAIAVGAFGTLLRSQDAGQSWVPVAPQFAGIFADPEQRLGPFFTPSLYGVRLLEDGRAWLCGELQLVLHSQDGGVTWQVLSAGSSSTEAVSPTLTALTMSEEGTGYAVGQGGTLLATSGKGQVWQALDIPVRTNLLGVDVTDTGAVIISAVRDLQLSMNRGANWQAVTSTEIEADWYQGVAILPEAAMAVVVGDSARILRVKLLRQ